MTRQKFLRVKVRKVKEMMMRRLQKRISFTQFWLSNLASKAEGLIRRNGVDAYWWNRVVNFGDLITPFLLRKYGLTPIYASMEDATVLSTGSILTNLSSKYSGYILGSGLIRDEVKSFPNANILAVRGALTRERVGASSSTILGDPGLLMSKFLKDRQVKKHRIGLIPHYADKLDPRILQISQRHASRLLVIDVQRGPMDILKDIDSCEFILSSSLHGLIMADALGIPNGWIVFSDKVAGNGFKFYDYFSAFGEKYDSYQITGVETLADFESIMHPVSARIPDVKVQLDQAFKNFSRNILGT